jgi:hypothetical protein
VTYIDKDAFYESRKVTIKGIKGSYAEEYAQKKNIAFEEL